MMVIIPGDNNKSAQGSIRGVSIRSGKWCGYRCTFDDVGESLVILCIIWIKQPSAPPSPYSPDSSFFKNTRFREYIVVRMLNMAQNSILERKLDKTTDLQLYKNLLQILDNNPKVLFVISREKLQDLLIIRLKLKNVDNSPVLFL